MLLDQEHEILASLKRNTESNYVAMAEPRYRSFVEQKIGEIGVLRICQSEHVRGYSVSLIDLPHQTERI